MAVEPAWQPVRDQDSVTAALEQALGHIFADRTLLTRALTHASAGGRGRQDNERLEFLGDRVLGLVIADLLFRRFPKDKEGDLTRRLVQLVRADTLTAIGEGLGLSAYLKAAFGDLVTAQRSNPTALADAVEALIAALYLDGGLSAARRFIEQHWAERLGVDVRPQRDTKTGLQEWALARALPLPKYEVTGREGPDHAPVFTVAVSVEGQGCATASGASKKLAEQAAAGQLLQRLTEGEKS
jgi:ribonuclease-3